MSTMLLAAALVFGIVAAVLALTPKGTRWIIRQFRHALTLRTVLLAGAVSMAALSAAALILPGHPHVLSDLVVMDGGLLGGLGVAASIFQRNKHPFATPRRVLAIGAHPDDLELACGATLAKLADGGHQVKTLVMSRGTVGGDDQVRILEAQRGSSFLGSRDTTVFDFEDTRLADASQDMVNAIEREIRDFKPDVVLTHSVNDYHQDHLAVHLATMRAARQHSAILCFESPSVTKDFTPSFYIDVDGYVDVKVEAVALHRDQAGKPYMTSERVRGQMAFRGAQVKKPAAEGFEAVRLLGSAVGDL
ncbi:MULTISPECIES: PIG-L deacetylase family protein [Arthrobacter]|uniref:PIG-L deacetylase family protein n=2 Tax=Arthrobacter TaxID=1663 RepID=A0ABU9KHP0_9MICC|nr:PIG-L deacetylase family protein [Arthrobacter sp. YJM1]MDP5226580.1 PIG-L deacetylase family protein [Arthrobacter sp. YJM1]